MVYDDVTKALSYIIKTYGREVLSDNRRCVALLNDLAPKKKNELLLLKHVLDNGLAVKFLKATTERERADALKAVYNELCNTVRLNNDAAEEACNIFANALGWSVKLNNTAKKEQEQVSKPPPKKEQVSAPSSRPVSPPKTTVKATSPRKPKISMDSPLSTDGLGMRLLKMYVGGLGILTFINFVLGIFAFKSCYSFVMSSAKLVLVLSVALVATGIIIGIINSDGSEPYAAVCDGYPGFWAILNLLLLIVMSIAHKFLAG